jgi:hypothetical protein
MKTGILTLLILFFCQFLSAQGLILDDEEYNQIPQLTSLSGLKDADRPVQVDLSAYCPTVRNQGDVYSCVGWAVGYGALTIKKAIKYQWQDRRTINEQAYSAMFIYNQIKKGDCGQGAKISDALQLLRSQGDCLASHFDTDIEDCNIQPDRDMLARMKLDTISDYLSLFPLDADATQKTSRVIHALARQEPVIIGMAVRKNFYQLQGAKYWWPDLGNTAPAGGHAMVVVGYDLASASFLLYNSWGTDWGSDGYIRIKFADFGRFCKYAFIIQLGTAVLPTTHTSTTEVYPLKTMSGSAQLNYLKDFSSQNEPIFKNTALQAKGDGIYTCTQGSWPIGQLFQMAAYADQQGLYLYAFSIDAQQKAQVHWPRTAHLNEKFAGMNESALLIDAKAPVSIPGKNKALRLSEQGADVMYLLFASQPIKHLDFIIAKINTPNDNYRSRLEAILGKHLVPLPDIVFAPDQASFTATTRSRGYIVPIVVTLSAD